MAANTHYQNTGAVDEKLVINLDRDETTRMAARKSFFPLAAP